MNRRVSLLFGLFLFIFATALFAYSASACPDAFYYMMAGYMASWGLYATLVFSKNQSVRKQEEICRESSSHLQRS